ncbi:alpha/beta-hydrolase [Setomelanomma holmii]|uniref:Alpha/beta-hydrolase n=1 Tax=Setomelanomma holmii TaxID=210430 RepID=A0A9P4LID1_9PLEO|nr:alpha/beta-hydrolase [Setomelanomma holmii]
MFQFSTSFMFDFELTRILGSTSSGGCDAGEFKSAVGKIRKHDAESWFMAWNEQSERTTRIGDEAAKAGFKVLAKSAYLRASNYFRAASYMFSNNDARVVPYSEKYIKSFQRAATLMDGEVVLVDIPYENGVSLPGYLCMPPNYARLPGKAPIVLYAGGADSTKEELYFLFGHSGPQLGYAVLYLEGPGQGLILKKSKIPLRPNFEVVASHALDFIEKFSQSRTDLELDVGRIAVAGAATGGYFALRAATDVRMKACVAIDPFFSIGCVMNDIVNRSTDAITKGNFQAAWEMGVGKRSMGVEKSTDMLRRCKDFSLQNAKDGNVLDNVKCPVFLTGPGSGQEMYASADDSTLRIEKLLKNVPGSITEIGTWALWAQKSFLFLDKHFEMKREPL